MPKPTKIVTDPRVVAEILSKPSTTTHEEAIRSILAQNGKVKVQLSDPSATFTLPASAPAPSPKGSPKGSGTGTGEA